MLKHNVEDLTHSNKGLDSRWFSEDNSDEDKIKTREVLLNSTIQFRLLKTILKHEFDKASLKPQDFDKPNIIERRHYFEGYQRSLQEIFRILP